MNVHPDIARFKEITHKKREGRKINKKDMSFAKVMVSRATSDKDFVGMYPSWYDQLAWGIVEDVIRMEEKDPFNKRRGRK